MKKKTFQIFIAFAILAVLASVGIAGFSIYRQYKTDRDVHNSWVSENDSEELLEIHFFNVGEADSTLVTCGGYTMLIDGGSPDSSSFLYSYLEQNEIAFLDYMICTHPHEDHVGGLAGALNYAKVGTIYAPVTEYDTRAFNSFLKYVDKQEKTITIPTAGDSFTLGNATVEIIGPVDPSLGKDNENNLSIMIRIEYGKTSFLITGDAEEIEEQSVLDAGFRVKSTVLRVGHHGSYTSTSESFLKAVSPKYCVISVGKDNAYGHPHEEVLRRLEAYRTTVYRTDQNGSITCFSDGHTVRLSTEK